MKAVSNIISRNLDNKTRKLDILVILHNAVPQQNMVFCPNKEIDSVPTVTFKEGRPLTYTAQCAFRARGTGNVNHRSQ